jgi:type II secretory pathway pseudopilin PulG
MVVAAMLASAAIAATSQGITAKQQRDLQEKQANEQMNEARRQELIAAGQAPDQNVDSVVENIGGGKKKTATDATSNVFSQDAESDNIYGV